MEQREHQGQHQRTADRRHAHAQGALFQAADILHFFLQFVLQGEHSDGVGQITLACICQLQCASAAGKQRRPQFFLRALQIFGQPTLSKYLHEPEDGSAVGSFLVEKLNARCEELGIEILMNTRAEKILVEDGKAIGVEATGDTADYTIKANAVVLATGGFGSNFDMMTQYDESLANAVTTNHAGATGDGILMAQEIGADTVDMEQIQLHPTVYQETGMLVSESVRSMGGILINAEGKRFCNDMSTRDAVSAAELEQTGAYAYIIFDQRIVDNLKSTQKYINSGLTVSADTYEELAELMGLEGDAAEAFPESMATWNEAVAAGEDAEFGRNNGMDEDLSTAPYYAIKIAPGIHHTMGGLKIDTEAQVIDTEGNAIPGLFACGETTGGVHGGNRIGGNAVCDFVVFGRIAGTNAAAFAAE